MSGGPLRGMNNGVGGSPVTLVKYNDFTFSEYTTVRLNVAKVTLSTTVDYADRYTLIVDSIIPKNSLAAGQGSSDLDINLLKSTIFANGKWLYVENTGLGTITIRGGLDTGVGYYKESTGVITKDLILENMGDGQTVRVVWTCEWTSLTSSNGLFNVDVIEEYEINHRGILQRTFTFIATSLAGFDIQTVGTEYPAFKRNMIQAFFEQYNLLPLASGSMGFAEYDWTMSLSADRKVATIKRVERQIDSYVLYPNSVEKIQITHRTGSSLEQDAGFRRWNNELRGTITLYPNQSKFAAWFAYVNIFRQRYERGIQQVQSKGYFGRTYTKVMWPRILSIEISEDIYNEGSMTFVVKYDQFINSLLELSDRTGLMQPVAVTNLDVEWFTSKPNYSVVNPWVNYGQNTFTTEGYLSQGGDNHTTSPTLPLMSFYSQYNPQQALTTQTNCPPQDDSWLKYENKWSFVNKRDIKRYERYLNVNRIDSSQSTGDKYRYNITSDPQVETTGGTDHQIYSVTGAGSQMLEMRGFAVRFGGPTDPPNPSQHAGKKLQLVDEFIDDRMLTSSACPIHVTKWVKTYYIVGTVDSSSDQQNTDSQMDVGPFQHS